MTDKMDIIHYVDISNAWTQHHVLPTDLTFSNLLIKIVNIMLDDHINIWLWGLVVRCIWGLYLGGDADADVPSPSFSLLLCTTQAPEWRSGLRHCISMQEVSLQYMVEIQAASHLAMIGSPIRRWPKLAHIAQVWPNCNWPKLPRFSWGDLNDAF